MTTSLEKPLAREVVIGGEPYKVVISPDGVRITAKGRRLGVMIPWLSLLAVDEKKDAGRSTQSENGNIPGVPKSVAADVAREVKLAGDALNRARTALVEAGTLPAALLVGMDPDPAYGGVENRNDWYIEPLLTDEEVASILRIPRRAVPNFEIDSVVIGGQTRYRQSEVRRFIRDNERKAHNHRRF
jgi:hypothetical protein